MQRWTKDQRVCILMGIIWKRGRNGRCGDNMGKVAGVSTWEVRGGGSQGPGKGWPWVDVETATNEE